MTFFQFGKKSLVNQFNVGERLERHDIGDDERPG
jgi:hypothetical protein